MKIPRAAHDPAELLAFYEESLSTLGALCERTWHDRLEVVAEGRVAALWNAGASIHEVELHFAPADATIARDAARDVFPGCPLTFHLAEALRLSPLPLERFVLRGEKSSAPEPAVAEKRWRLQFPDTVRWQLAPPFKAGYHFTLLALARCEVQAIDQHWSLHRLALSLPSGTPDDDLAHEIAFHQSGGQPSIDAPWPDSDPTRWNALLQQALEEELSDDLAPIRARQENSLRRELERIDDYFGNYARELTARAARTGSEASKAKTADRLAAAQAEHTRRRSDQIARHEIRVLPHLDALLMIAEPAWHTEVRVDRAHRTETFRAHFIPRSRQWEVTPAI